MKPTLKFKDVNDKLMKSAGFKKVLFRDNSNINLDSFIYWDNKKGLRLMTTAGKKITLERLINYAIDQAAYRTRKRYKELVANLDFGKDGFIYE